MPDCCENGPAAVPDEPERDYSILPENLMNRNTNHIHFSSLNASEQQAFCDYINRERERHMDDIRQIDSDLTVMRERYGLLPRLVFLGKWLEVS